MVSLGGPGSVLDFLLVAAGSAAATAGRDVAPGTTCVAAVGGFRTPGPTKTPGAKNTLNSGFRHVEVSCPGLCLLGPCVS